MNTERPSPRYTNLDLWEPADILDAMIEGQLAAVAAVRAVRQRVGGPIKTAVVGLGTGTFACFSQPGDTFKFYEIDASVEKLARTSGRGNPIVGIALTMKRLANASGRPGHTDLVGHIQCAVEASMYLVC